MLSLWFAHCVRICGVAAEGRGVGGGVEGVGGVGGGGNVGQGEE